MGIENWSTTAADNNDSPPNGMPENQAPSTVNNSVRQFMADVRTWYENAQWVNLGLTPTYASSTSFTVSGDYTSTFHQYRRIKIVDASTIYGTIASSSYSAPNTTVTVTLDSGSITGSISAVHIAAMSASNDSFPRYINGAINFVAGLNVTGNIAITSGKVTGLSAASTNGDAVRYEQAALLAAANTFSQDNTFAKSGPNVYIKDTSGSNNAHLWFVSSAGYARCIAYWDLSSDQFILRMYDTDGVTERVGIYMTETGSMGINTVNGIALDSPSGGNLGSGTINVSTSLSVNNVAAILDGSGTVDQTNIASSAVGQGELKSTTGSGSKSIAAATNESYTLTGGTYSWFQLSGNGSNSIVYPGGTNQAAGTLGLYSSPGETMYIKERYIQASPPYGKDENEIWHLFLYALIQKGSGDIKGFSVAPDPIWAYHGPTDIRGQYMMIDKNRFLSGLESFVREIKQLPPAAQEKYDSRLINLIDAISVTGDVVENEKHLVPIWKLAHEIEEKLIKDNADRVSEEFRKMVDAQYDQIVTGVEGLTEDEKAQIKNEASTIVSARESKLINDMRLSIKDEPNMVLIDKLKKFIKETYEAPKKEYRLCKLICAEMGGDKLFNDAIWNAIEKGDAKTVTYLQERFNNDPYVQIEITIEYKNSDMDTASHPFGIVPADCEIALLCPRDTEMLGIMHKTGGDYGAIEIRDRFLQGKVKINNDHIHDHLIPKGMKCFSFAF